MIIPGESRIKKYRGIYEDQDQSNAYNYNGFEYI